MNKWKINYVTDVECNEKEVPQKRLDRIYTIDYLSIGSPAIMAAAEGAMVSSLVKYFHETAESLVIETENSIYHFETVTENEEENQ